MRFSTGGIPSTFVLKSRFTTTLFGQANRVRSDLQSEADSVHSGKKLIQIYQRHGLNCLGGCRWYPGCNVDMPAVKSDIAKFDGFVPSRDGAIGMKHPCGRNDQRNAIPTMALLHHRVKEEVFKAAIVVEHCKRNALQNFFRVFAGDARTKYLHELDTPCVRRRRKIHGLRTWLAGELHCASSLSLQNRSDDGRLPEKFDPIVGFVRVQEIIDRAIEFDAVTYLPGRILIFGIFFLASTLEMPATVFWSPLTCDPPLSNQISHFLPIVLANPLYHSS